MEVSIDKNFYGTKKLTENFILNFESSTFAQKLQKPADNHAAT